VVSATDAHGRILGFLDRSRYYFFQVAPQLYSRGWVDPVPDPLHPSTYLSIYLWLYSPCGPWPLFHFLNLYTVGRTPWTGDQPVATTQTQTKCTHTSMHRVGFEPTTADFERAKTGHALDQIYFNFRTISSGRFTIWEQHAFPDFSVHFLITDPQHNAHRVFWADSCFVRSCTTRMNTSYYSSITWSILFISVKKLWRRLKQLQMK
jgi:hypothetical protein